MAEKVDVTLSVTGEDLAFLVWAMHALKGKDDLAGYWRVVFQRTLEENFERGELPAEFEKPGLLARLLG
jgi:hypothetical protein